MALRSGDEGTVPRRLFIESNASLHGNQVFFKAALWSAWMGMRLCEMFVAVIWLSYAMGT